jgi:hypothetical protein
MAPSIARRPSRRHTGQSTAFLEGDMNERWVRLEVAPPVETVDANASPDAIDAPNIGVAEVGAILIHARE